MPDGLAGEGMAMARPTWKGHISFGLVHIPVSLYSVDQRADVSFHLMDSRDSARIRYQRVNELTGDEVPWDNIVKGYEYSDGNYIVLSDEDLQSAAPEMTRQIEIEQFVNLADIGVTLFDRPYVLVPERGGEKGYALLRDAMQTSQRVGIAQVVIRSRSYLAALMPEGDALLLVLLRYQQELRDLSDFKFPGHTKAEFKTSKKELDLAVQLIDGMTSKWNPTKYQDEYRDALMKLIERRIKSGDTIEGNEPEETAEETQPRTVNFMEMLKRSVQKQSALRRKAPVRSPRSRKPRKKKAG